MYAGNLYADIPRGIFLVRGENVLLLGEIVCVLPLETATCHVPLLTMSSLGP